MSPLELAAAAFSALSVYFTIKRNLWLWPTGLIGTALYVVVFGMAKLYGSTALQVFFIVVQIYGWWFWARKDASGHEPPIANLGLRNSLMALIATVAVSLIVGFVVSHTTDAHAPIPDNLILGLSITAQILLSRKLMENWPFWIIVDVGSVALYASQGLLATAALYLLFLGMALWGWWEWRGAARRQDQPA